VPGQKAHRRKHGDWTEIFSSLETRGLMINLANITGNRITIHITHEPRWRHRPWAGSLWRSVGDGSSMVPIVAAVGNGGPCPQQSAKGTSWIHMIVPFHSTRQGMTIGLSLVAEVAQHTEDWRRNPGVCLVGGGYLDLDLDAWSVGALNLWFHTTSRSPCCCSSSVLAGSGNRDWGWRPCHIMFWSAQLPEWAPLGLCHGWSGHWFLGVGAYGWHSHNYSDVMPVPAGQDLPTGCPSNHILCRLWENAGICFFWWEEPHMLLAPDQTSTSDWPADGRISLRHLLTSSGVDPYHEVMCVVPQSLWPYDPFTLRYMMSHQNIQSPPSLEDFRFETFSHETHLIHMTTSEEPLRVLFFTRSLTVDLVHQTDVARGPPHQIQVD
jgi:hypothetical protein